MTKLRWLITPVTAGLLVLAVACGGDENGGSSTSGSGDSTGSGSGVRTELDLGSAADQLAELRSFRFDVSLKMDFGTGAPGSDGLTNALMALFSDIEMEGAYVAPDSLDMQMDMGGRKVHMVQIGGRAWINEGSGWEETDADSNAWSFMGDPSEMAFDFLPQELLRNAKTKSEKVNGQQTTRYSFDKKALESLAADLGEDTADLDLLDEAELDVWLTKDNIPVKISMDMKGRDEQGNKMSIVLEFSIKDLNSDRIKIEAPI